MIPFGKITSFFFHFQRHLKSGAGQLALGIGLTRAFYFLVFLTDRELPLLVDRGLLNQKLTSCIVGHNLVRS